MSKNYEVWVQKSLFGIKFWGIKRATFVIDEQGLISKIIDKVSVRDHARQIL